MSDQGLLPDAVITNINVENKENGKDGMDLAGSSWNHF